MNRFAEAQTVDQVVRQAVGAGSCCWRGSVFDTEAALRVAEDATERIEQIHAT